MSVSIVQPNNSKNSWIIAESYPDSQLTELYIFCKSVHSYTFFDERHHLHVVCNTGPFSCSCQRNGQVHSCIVVLSCEEGRGLRGSVKDGEERVEVGGRSGEKTGWGDDRRNDREREGRS